MTVNEVWAGTGPMIAPWTELLASPERYDGTYGPTVVGNGNFAIYSGATFGNDQFSQCSISAYGEAFTGFTLGVRFDFIRMYDLLVDASFGGIRRQDNIYGLPAVSLLSLPYPWALGEVARFEAVGSMLRAYANGVLIGEVEDTNYADGAIGLGIVPLVGVSGRWGHWSGGDVEPPPPPAGSGGTARYAYRNRSGWDV